MIGRDIYATGYGDDLVLVTDDTVTRDRQALAPVAVSHAGNGACEHCDWRLDRCAKKAPCSRHRTGTPLESIVRWGERATTARGDRPRHCAACRRRAAIVPVRRPGSVVDPDGRSRANLAECRNRRRSVRNRTAKFLAIRRRWTHVGAWNHAPRMTLRAQGDTVYGVDDNGERTIARSRDGGRSWSRLRLPAPRTSPYGLIETRTGSVIAATHDGIFRTLDDGITWHHVGVQHENIKVLEAEPGRAMRLVKAAACGRVPTRIVGFECPARTIPIHGSVQPPGFFFLETDACSA